MKKNGRTLPRSHSDSVLTHGWPETFSMGSMRTISARLACQIISIVLFASVALAQTGTGSIAGTIRDSSGGVIPGATVTATQASTNLSRSTTTNSTGYYLFPFLTPATYTIKASKTGFQSYVRENIVIDVNLTATIDTELRIGGTSQAVTVTAEAPVLETSSSSVGEVVSNTQIVELPINGRNSFGFAVLVPGVLAPYGFSQTSTMYNDQFMSVNGSRPNQNTFVMDGGNATQPAFNGLGFFPPLDSVQEYKIQTSNYSAEFSNSAGGVVNIITKSGSDRFHGSAYEFLRNNVLDANDFFVNRAGQKTPPYRFNQFGGTFGGPLPKTKGSTFFFMSYEGLRWVQSAAITGTVPTVAQRNGDFSQTRNAAGQLITIYNPFTTAADPAHPGSYLRTPFSGNQIPQSSFDPVAANIVKYLPLPNTPGNPITGTNNYFTNMGLGLIKDTGTIRLDHSLTTNQKIDGVFMINNMERKRDTIFGPQLAAASPTFGNDQANQRYVTLHYTNAISPTFVMELTSSFIRYYLARKIPSDGFDLTKLGWPSSYNSVGNMGSCFPTIFASGLSLSSNLTTDSIFSAFTGYCFGIYDAFQTFSEIANFNRVNGSHSLKFGGNFGSKAVNGQSYTNAPNYWYFTSGMTQGPNPYAASTTAGTGFASLLLGAGSSGFFYSGAPAQQLINRYFGIYFQDDWKATHKLTLNLGIRYDYESPWTERRNRLSDFNFTAPSPLQVPGLNLVGGLEYPGVNGLPRGQFDSNWKHVVPRLGFAYQLTSGTVMRSGFGMFTGNLTGGDFHNNATPSTGYLSTTSWVTTLNSLTPYNLLSNPYPSGFVAATGSSLGLATALGGSAIGLDRHMPSPYAMEWNFGIQRSLPGKFVLHLDYAASRGIHLLGCLNANQLPDNYLSMGSALAQLVTNPFYGKITIGSLSNKTVAQRQLLLPYPQFTAVTSPNAAFGTSEYHALQMNLERRFSNGLSFQAAYTYSKTMDDVPGTTLSAGLPGGEYPAGAIQNYYNRRGSWAPAIWDTPQNLVLNGLYQLPFGPQKRFLNNGGPLAKVVGGWQLGGIVTLHSGPPLSFTTATNTLGNNGGTQTPNLTGVSPYVSGSASSKVNQWFNPAAFAIPPTYTYGNVGRTVSWLRGPAYQNLDLALDKNTRISEKVTVQFRFESFNTLNHPWFGLPNTTIGSVAAGIIADAQNTPRTLQFALKLLF
jgi:outer membrane receptor protein involved in Fe transport